MRFTSLVALVPLAASLATLATAREYEYNDAREYIDELSLRETANSEDLSTRSEQILSELSTRELIDELSDRLERRTRYGTCKNCNLRKVIKGGSCTEPGGHVLKPGTIVDH
ncbi:hypothetical protein D9611_013022 [Ephemerocybe angulata]|uniref:Uncharacterized protein n=1 Tax=Ephemerocybe angulata TaxID=980116 RepID=A0A8H5AUJ2_9AGAR|nr:hypothetical protein D9611_013022 [Tulosesus angulatus]